MKQRDRLILDFGKRPSRALRQAACASAAGLALACAGAAPSAPASPPSAGSAASAAEPVTLPALPEEKHLANLLQLTFEGENAEAYWSWDGTQLSLQSKLPGQGCDRIYRMPLSASGAERVPVSSGEGATTCSYFLPGDREIL